MKTLLRGGGLLALCLLSGLWAQAQKMVVTYHDPFRKHIHQVAMLNAAGDYHGLYKEYYPGGNIAKEWNYLNGEKHGRCSTYDDGGGVSMLSSLQTFNRGVIDGLEKTYKATSGEGYGMFMFQETMWKDQSEVWRKTYWETTDGKHVLAEEEIYASGSRRVVIERHFSRTGRLTLIKSDTGRNFQADEDGTLRAEFYTRDGQRHGPERQWWRNGRLRVSRNYEYGELAGAYHEWDKAGALIRSAHYEGGVEFDALDSASLTPQPDGSLVWMSVKGGKFAEGSAGADGKPIGEFRKFYPSGNLFALEHYSGARLDSTCRWYTDGSVMIRIYYSASGQPDSMLHYRDVESQLRFSSETSDTLHLREVFRDGQMVEKWQWGNTHLNRPGMVHYVRNEKNGEWVFSYK